ncbi:MAG: hypothetical protein CMJ75_01805 [Planctomycetaceae bacterium]|nr:hypothetical protein [Planctomycetaceae bacterium]
MMKHLSTNLLWAAAYGIFLATTVGSLFWVRGNVAQQFQNTQSQSDWDLWRQEAARQSQGTGPVQRRVPQSRQPPIVVLMGQHFVVCVAAVATLGSALFGTLMFLIRGAWADTTPAPHLEPVPASGSPDTDSNL